MDFHMEVNVYRLKNEVFTMSSITSGLDSRTDLMRFPQSAEVNFRISPVITTEYLYHNNGWYHYCSFRDTRSCSFHHVLQTILSENSGKMKCMRYASPFSFAL